MKEEDEEEDVVDSDFDIDENEDEAGGGGGQGDGVVDEEEEEKRRQRALKRRGVITKAYTVKFCSLSLSINDISGSPIHIYMNIFIYSSSLWSTSLSPSTNGCLSYSTDNQEHNRQQSHHPHQMTNLKPVSNEPLSPALALIQEHESSKPVATIHRRPMLIEFTD